MQPSLQKYDCAGCGECCRGRFAIVISQEDRDRIVAQNWDTQDLGMGRAPLFTPYKGGYHLAHHADGSCVFLTEDSRCRIHAKFGEETKPLACRLYPFNFVPLGNQVRVDIRFDCPSAAGNVGRSIPEHKQYLQQLVNDALPEKSVATTPPPFTEGVQLTWTQLYRANEAVERVLMDVSLDITRRIVACVNLVDLMRTAPKEAFADGNFGAFLDKAVSIAQEEAIHDDLDRVSPHKTQQIVFRQLLGAYGRVDHVGQKAEWGHRLDASLRMLAGKGQVPTLRDNFPTVGFAAIDQMRGIPLTSEAECLERYLHVHMESMGYFGQTFYGQTFVNGLTSLLLTYPFICWFARAYALGDGLATPNARCFKKALQIVDHHRGVTPLLDMPGEKFRDKFLRAPDVLRSFVIWYGS
jgi:Fe-S-cluster containining protein